MNGRNVLRFTQVIHTVLQSGMNLGQAMEMIQKMNGVPQKVVRASCQIKTSLEQGRLFSNALADCDAIRFAPDYVAFVAAAEKGGSVQMTFDFLLKRESEKEKRKNSMVSICVYPLIVIVVAFLGGLLLAFNSRNIVPDVSGTFNFESYERQVFWGCVKANVFLFSSALFLFMWFRQLIHKNIVLDVFCIISFLIKGTMSLDEALKVSVLSAQKNDNLKRRIIRGRDMLLHGNPVPSVVECIDKDCSLFASFAEINGDLKNAFGQMTSYLEDKKTRREKMCMDMVEPLTMCVVAAYIIILLKDIVMPVIFYFGG